MVAISGLFLRLASAITIVAAASSHPPFLSPRVVHAERASAPTGWRLHRRADPGLLVPLKISLAQSNLENLEAYLLEVSDPESENYGKHWTAEQVAETFRPSQKSVDTVRSWLLNDCGIDGHKIHLGHNGGAFHLNVTIAEAEHILGADYYVYRRGEDGAEGVAVDQRYYLPAHVSRHVDDITPTLHLPAMTPRQLTKRQSGSKSIIGRPSGAPKALVQDGAPPNGTERCDKFVTLECLRELYNFRYEPIAPEKNKVAVVELGDQVYRQNDLNMFFKKYSPELVRKSPTLVSITGGHLNPNETDYSDLAESTMDFQLIMGLLGPEQVVMLYQVDNEGGVDYNDALVAAMDESYCRQAGFDAAGYDCGGKPKSYVVSMSYHTGIDAGLHPDPTDDGRILQRVCSEIGKLSLTGVTFVVSSGDHGVAYGSSEQCLSPDGKLVSDGTNGTFLGQFPASCPYVTAVGATQLPENKTVHDAEHATTAFYSGGGFSNLFTQPLHQHRAVSKYLKNYAPNYGKEVFNRTGRAYPDVAANGYPTVVAVNDNFSTSGGTSASAPIFAAMVSAINDARLVAGKGPVGWINPALYSHLFTNAFNDITVGENPGCGTHGFPASPGWDPVTGLGTPHFERLLSRFLVLP